MVSFRPRWGWRRIALLSTLTLLAGLAGVGSELLAAKPDKVHFTFRGRQLNAVWAFDTIFAEVQATDGVNGPGKPSPVTVAFVYGNDWSVEDGFVLEFWGSADIDPGDLSISRNLEAGSLNTVIPVLQETWTEETGWSGATPAQAAVSVGLVGEEKPVNEHSMTHLRSSFRSGDSSFRQSIKQRVTARSVLEVSGTGSIVLSDGVTTTEFVPPGTEVSWGALRSVNQGYMEITHWQ